MNWSDMPLRVIQVISRIFMYTSICEHIDNNIAIELAAVRNNKQSWNRSLSVGSLWRFRMNSRIPDEMHGTA